jgi:hypothetical protein
MGDKSLSDSRMGQTTYIWLHRQHDSWPWLLALLLLLPLLALYQIPRCLCYKTISMNYQLL